MLKFPGMLMVGAAGRNAGKTTLAAALVRQFKPDNPIIAVKVTTIRENDGTCPRGGDGCGVCSSLEGNYCITEELDPDTGKDTSRLLAAGANRVYWLRTMKNHLVEAAGALNELPGNGEAVVCESNSLRLAVEPDVFLMATDRAATPWKTTADAVKDYVDREIGRTTDFAGSPGDISLHNGRWALKEPATAIVLAGGQSRRMGTDKAKLTLGNSSLIEKIYDNLKPHVNELLISTSDPSGYSMPGAVIVADRTPGEGPLMGIASALERSSHEVNLVIACDMPELDRFLLRDMMRKARHADAVVPRSADGNLHPLFAVYRKKLLPLINRLLASGERKPRAVFDQCRTAYAEAADTSLLLDVDTRQDYLQYVQTRSEKGVAS